MKKKRTTSNNLLLIILVAFPFNLIGQPINPWTPPEYFPSKAVLIEWPFNNNIWPLYSELIRECRLSAEVILIVRDQTEENQMTSKLLNDSVPLSNISFIHVPCERMWIRDHGPLAVFAENGVCYMDFDDLANSGFDENLPTNLASAWGLDSYQFPYVFCGGNFMVDNYNTLFSTSRLYSNNPGYSQNQIDQVFSDYMGIDNIVTVSAQHNDYWGHIDMQIKLLNDTTIVMSSVTPGSGPNYDSLENNYNILSSLIAPNGKPYHIARLPMADDWKTYANSLIINNRAIVPIYDHPNDSIALQTYQQFLPAYDIIGINSNSIIAWEGAVHCITMQLFDDSQITSIKDLSVREEKMTLFPNPVKRNGNFRIICREDICKPVYAEIINTLGEVLEVIDIEGRNQPFEFTFNYPPGLYQIRIVYENNSSISDCFIAN